MTTPDDESSESRTSSAFEQLDQSRSMSLVEEFWVFLREEKKWWLAPIILVLLVVGAVALLTTTGAAPFIYTLF